MGQRVFYEQMLSDSLHGADGRVSDEIDVVTLKDYMQVSRDISPDFLVHLLASSILVYSMNYHPILVDERIIGVD